MLEGSPQYYLEVDAPGLVSTIRINGFALASGELLRLERVAIAGLMRDGDNRLEIELHAPLAADTRGVWARLWAEFPEQEVLVLAEFLEELEHAADDAYPRELVQDFPHNCPLPPWSWDDTASLDGDAEESEAVGELLVEIDEHVRGRDPQRLNGYFELVHGEHAIASGRDRGQLEAAFVGALARGITADDFVRAPLDGDNIVPHLHCDDRLVELRHSNGAPAIASDDGSWHLRLVFGKVDGVWAVVLHPDAINPPPAATPSGMRYQTALEGGRRRLIVEVGSGVMHGTRHVVEPGASATVGRTRRATIVVPDDPLLEGAHFRLDWDGHRCTVRDLDTGEGTLLGGEEITISNVNHADWIVAGQTHFGVFFEGGRRLLPEAPRPTAEKQLKRRALATLQQQAALYAVVDPTRDDRVVELLREHVDTFANLYEGDATQSLPEAAPYLVQLRSDSKLLARLIEEGWGQRWAIYLSSERPFKKLRRHLRRFLMVHKDSDAQKVYFRYYDPQVMRLLLDIATPAQRQDLYECVDAFAIDDADHGVALFQSPRVT